MGQVLQFFRPEKAFDTEATAALVAAYEKAIARIEKRGLPHIMREVAARRIVALASKGERDAERLCTAVLATIAKASVAERVILKLPSERMTSR